MNAYKTCFFLTVTLIALVSDAADSIPEFWNSGAEINRYELSQIRYGESHPGHAEFVFVTEPFLTGKQIKHEFGAGPSTKVLKLNALRTFNTGLYSYRTMTSTFRPTDLAAFPHALKSTTTIQDWCGQTFQQYNRKEDGWKLERHSYFQNEGDQSRTLSDAFLEDEIWLLIRLDPQQLPSGTFKAIPGAIDSQFSHREITPNTATAKLETKGQTTHYSLTYPELKRRLKISFDTASPHVIREWEETEAQGTTKAVLTHRLTNVEYWSQHKASDAPKRKSLGLEPIAD